MRRVMLMVLWLGLGQAAQAQLQFEGENLLVPVPEGFELAYEAQDETGEIREYVPEGENWERWSRMLTVQVFRERAGVDPKQFLAAMQITLAEACQGVEAGQFSEGTNGMIADAQATFFCPLNPGTGLPETFIARAFGGADALYVVQFAWRSVPDDGALEVGSEFLSTVAVCDTRNIDVPCPEGSQ